MTENFYANQAEDEFRQLVAQQEAEAAAAAAAAAAPTGSDPKAPQNKPRPEVPPKNPVPSNTVPPETSALPKPPVPPETPEERIERENLIRLLRTHGNSNLPALPATVTATFTTLDLEKAIYEMQKLSEDSEIQIRILDSVAERKINFYQDLIALETEDSNHQRKLDDKSLILFADSINLKYFLDNFPVFRRMFITSIDELKRNGLVLKYILSKTQKRLLREEVEKESKNPPKVGSEIISSAKESLEKEEVLRQVYKLFLHTNKILSIKTSVLNKRFVKRRELIKTHASILFDYLCFEVYQLRRLLEIHNSFIKGGLFANQNITGLRRMGNTREVEVIAGRYQSDGMEAKLVFRYNTIVSQTSTGTRDSDRLPYFRISLEPMNRGYQEETQYVSLRYDTDFTKGQERKPVLSIDLTGFRDSGGNYPLYRNQFYQQEILEPTQNSCAGISGIVPDGRHHFIISDTQGTSDFNRQLIQMLRSIFNREV